jgi:hypothetical protein
MLYSETQCLRFCFLFLFVDRSSGLSGKKQFWVSFFSFGTIEFLFSLSFYYHYYDSFLFSSCLISVQNNCNPVLIQTYTDILFFVGVPKHKEKKTDKCTKKMMRMCLRIPAIRILLKRKLVNRLNKRIQTHSWMWQTPIVSLNYYQ